MSAYTCKSIYTSQSILQSLLPVSSYFICPIYEGGIIISPRQVKSIRLREGKNLDGSARLSQKRDGFSSCSPVLFPLHLSASPYGTASLHRKIMTELTEVCPNVDAVLLHKRDVGLCRHLKKKRARKEKAHTRSRAGIRHSLTYPIGNTVLDTEDTKVKAVLSLTEFTS